MKIEFDIPNFEKELSITVIIRKDGEVVCNTATPPNMIEKDKSTKSVKKSSGNLMDSEF